MSMPSARCLVGALGGVMSLPGQVQFENRTPAAVVSAVPQEAAAADVDGDGDLDLFTCTGLFGGPPFRRLLRNDGNEAFVDVSTTALPAQSGVGQNGRLVVLDFDGDGDLDLFSSNTGGIAVWRNLGNGTFADTGQSDPGSYTDLVAADLDGDGDVDVAASGNALVSSGSTVFVNQGGGTFVRANVLPQGFHFAIAAVDLDGDTDLDLVLGSSNGVIVLRNQGGLGFADQTAAWGGGLVPGSVRDIVVGDLDGDGRADLVVARQGVSSDDVLRNTGVAFVAGASLPTAANGSTRLALADVDEDGDLDLWRAGTGIGLWLGDGLGGFGSGAARVGTVGGSAPGLLPFDFDRDGDQDLLVVDPFTPAVLLVNRHRDLRPGQPVVGQAWQPVVWSQPGYATAPHFAGLGIATVRLPQPVTWAPYGELALDLATTIVLSGLAPVPGNAAVFPLVVPNVPVLQGLPVHVQGIVYAPPQPPRFTAWFSIAVQ